MVVPVESAELLLVLLTVLNPSCLSSFSDVALAVRAPACFPGPALGRPAFVFSRTIPVSAAVAAAVFVRFGRLTGFKGDVARVLRGF